MGGPMTTTGPDPATLQVLVVEDNGLIRDIFAYGLRKFFKARNRAISIDFAADGGEAWLLLSTKVYDLAIVDYYLPVMSGSQVVERARRTPHLAELPILGISVDPDEARAHFMRAGADVFLNKPLVLRDLVSTLEGLAVRGAP